MLIGFLEQEKENRRAVIFLYVETFKEKLIEARKNTGFTQKEVSEELNIPRSTLANYECGRTEPDLETLAKLADFYAVSADWLLGTKGNNRL